MSDFHPNTSPPPAQADPIASAQAPEPATATAPSVEKIKDGIVANLKTVYDPEIPIDIYELGLIYSIDVAEDRNVLIHMTLTSPNCPSAEQIPVDVEKKTRQVEGVKDVKVQVVWEPAWSKEKMSEDAKLALGIDE